MTWNGHIAYHSRSSTERDSPSGLSWPSPVVLLTSEEIWVISISFSLASARLSAGFLTFGVARATTGVGCRRLRMQKMHRLSLSQATTLPSKQPPVIVSLTIICCKTMFAPTWKNKMGRNQKDLQRCHNGHHEYGNQEAKGSGRHSRLSDSLLPVSGQESMHIALTRNCWHGEVRVGVAATSPGSGDGGWVDGSTWGSILGRWSVAGNACDGTAPAARANQKKGLRVQVRVQLTV